MKEYKFSLLIGIMLLFGSQECHGNKEECYAPAICSHEDKTIVGPLSGGRAYKWSNHPGMGMYPDELYSDLNFAPSKKACARDFPVQCASDKCTVGAPRNNTCPSSGAIIPAPIAPPIAPISKEICAPNNILNDLGKNLLCTQACKERNMTFSGEAHLKTGKKCPSNEHGDMCICR